MTHILDFYLEHLPDFEQFKASQQFQKSFKRLKGVLKLVAKYPRTNP